MNKILSSILIFFALFLLSACKKIINIDLNNASPKVVIDGYITDQSGPYTVSLSNTVDFSADVYFSPVTGALVFITDNNAGYTDTLKESAPGIYKTQSIAGVIGHSYKLSVKVQNNWYYANSTMPALVPFDSLYLQKFSFFGNTLNQFIPVFTDPIGQKNYYQFTVQVGDSLQNDINAWDDNLTDGKVNSRPINVNGSTDLFKGNDTCIVEMRCIDKSTFDYFNTLPNANGGASTPANPTSNVTGGALGYFSAYTVRRKTIIVQ
jgi:hypothetical protein